MLVSTKFITTVLLTLPAVVTAHHVMTKFSIDGVPQFNTIRQPGTVGPVIGLTSSALICGWPPGNGQGMKGTDKSLIYPGSNVTFEWHTNWSGSVQGPDGVTDDSHKGPCSIYMRKVDDSVTVDPANPTGGWFKIWEDGVDENGVFCTTRMRQNGGFFTGGIPTNLENGDFLLRAETITLNNAAPPNNEPQYYVGCAQVTLQKSERPFVSPDTVEIPGGEFANRDMPGLAYNIWHPLRDDFSDYGPVPGPRVFTGEGQGGGVIISLDTSSATSSATISSVGTSIISIPTGFSTISWPGPSTTNAPSTTTVANSAVLPTTVMIPPVQVTGSQTTTTSTTTVTSTTEIETTITVTPSLTGTPTSVCKPATTKFTTMFHTVKQIVLVTLSTSTEVSTLVSTSFLGTNGTISTSVQGEDGTNPGTAPITTTDCDTKTPPVRRGHVDVHRRGRIHRGHGH